MPHAVFSFFAEGGRRCYVTRVEGDSAVAATATVQDIDPANAMTITATSVGTWGNDLYYLIEDPTNASNTTHFKLTILYKETVSGRELVTTEVYDDIDAAGAVTAINGVSSFVTVTDEAGGRPINSPSATEIALTSGADDNANADFIGTVSGGAAEGTGLYSMDSIDEINILVMPDVDARDDQLTMLNWCEQRGDVFCVLDTPSGLNPSVAKDYKTGSGTYSAGAGMNSAYGALYLSVGLRARSQRWFVADPDPAVRCSCRHLRKYRLYARCFQSSGGNGGRCALLRGRRGTPDHHGRERHSESGRRKRHS